MRRPLCLLGLAFVAVLLLGSVLIPQEKKTAAHGIGRDLRSLASLRERNAGFHRRKKYRYCLWDRSLS